MARVLVTYASMAGSTAEVAQVVAEALTASGAEVDTRDVSQVDSLAGYDGVVLGGPMIMGWHRSALGFLRRHRAALRRLPLAVFVLALRLTETGEREVNGVPVCLDAELPQPPARPGRLDAKERYARLSNYVRPILAATRPARPVSIGVFGGRLEYGRLKWWAVLFAMLVIQARAGDRRNWPAIRAWAASLPAAMRLETHVTDLIAETA